MQQHTIPQFYLSEFVDPNTPTGYEPYVWVFNKGEKKGRKKAPSNLFKESDIYTITLKSGKKDYRIEQTLSNLESQYVSIFRSKIKQRLPLNEEEHVVLCAFVSVMLQRTLRHKDSIEKFLDELIERTSAIEKANGLGPKKSLKLIDHKKNAHKLSMVGTLPDITEILFQMNVAFLIAENGSKFVTSDDPCNMFNPDLQWQRFYSPGLAQKNVQVTLPLSPEIMLCLSWSNLRGYMLWQKDRVQEANRMIVGKSYEYFVSHNPSPKRGWFRRYPLDLFFIIKILNHKITMLWHRFKMWRQHGNVRRK